MALARLEVRDLYRKRARNYDITANLYYAIGFREQTYRRHAVAALQLQPGATVVDLCCGTGLNLPLLVDAVGPEGKVIGVDLTDSMLQQSARRVARHGWRNVELVQADVARYEIPHGVDGVLSTFALTLVTEYAAIISGAHAALRPGGCLVLLDFKGPPRAPRFVVNLGVAIMSPFGVTSDLMDRHPWEAMRTVFGGVELENVYFGFSYVARSQKPVLDAG